MTARKAPEKEPAPYPVTETERQAQPQTAQISQNDAFNTLNAVDCGGHLEQKNGLTYLSWAWAWAELKKRYPKSYYTIFENENGYNYFTDGKTCWVKTGVTVVTDEYSLEHIEYLPVMNNMNKSIPLANVTSTDINKSIQRSLTKAAARHGLGLYVYAGEDIPESAQEEAKNRLQEVADLQRDIGKEINRCVRKGQPDEMTTEEKKTFRENVISPILDISYMKCNDIGKLTELLEALKAA